jgi:iron only hydrogenase large subunit-like protein
MANPAHAVTGVPNQCIGCVACTRVCPTKAIRVRKGLVEVRSELCIDCGACIYACTHQARRARTSSPSDLKNFKHTVAMPSVTLYAQFGKDVFPDQVLRALTQIGFDSSYDISWMCEMVAAATEAHLSECAGPWPRISITCPAVVRLIQIRYPELLQHLVPIETPRELAAKLRRRRLSIELGIAPQEIGVFFITPCSAIMQSIHNPVGLEASHIDGAFSIAELYPALLKAIKHAKGTPHEDAISPAGLMWAMAGGEIGAMRNSNTLTVRGVYDVTRVFDRIESGKFQNVDFIEAYICPDGCVSGQLTVEGRFGAQRNVQCIAQRLRKQSTLSEEKVRSMIRDHFFDLEGEINAREVRPLAPDLRQAIAMRRDRTALVARLPGKNCAACGAPDCETLAEDVLRGEAKIEDCVFLEIEMLKQQLQGCKGGPR